MFIRLLTAPVNVSNQTKGVFLNNKECEYQLALINYILINTVKNYATIDDDADLPHSARASRSVGGQHNPHVVR